MIEVKDEKAKVTDQGFFFFSFSISRASICPSANASLNCLPLIRTQTKTLPRGVRTSQMKPPIEAQGTAILPHFLKTSVRSKHPFHQNSYPLKSNIP